MKKLFLLISIAFLAIACEGPTGPMGPPGENGGGAAYDVFYIPINKNDWVLVGGEEELNSYYAYTVSVSKITNYIYDYGTILAYWEIDGRFQTLLPYTRYYGSDNGTNEKLWSEHLEFEYTEGSMTFYSTISDFYNIGKRPESTEIKVVLIWD